MLRLLFLFTLVSTTTTSLVAQCSTERSDALSRRVAANFELFDQTLIDLYQGDWFALVKDEDRIASREKEAITEFRNDIVQLLVCQTQAEVLSREKASRSATTLPADALEYVRAGSAGSEGFSSDIDVNLKGDGTEYAVAAINEAFKKMMKSDKEIGEMFDINFYAKDFVPTLTAAQKQQQNGLHFYEKDDWREFVLRDAELQRQDVEFQTVMAYVFMRKNMRERDFSVYLDCSKGTPDDLKKEALLKYANYLARLASAEDEITAITMGSENRAYEEMLVKAADKRIAFLQARSRNDGGTEAAYLDWKKAKTYSTLHANEAHCTAGAIVHVVANKQMLDALYKPGKPTKRKLKLSEHELFQSFTEQVGFTFHKIDHSETAADLVKLGKYVHRAYNAMKHFYALTGYEPAYTERERLAATDWEGVKKGYRRDDKGKFTNQISDKEAELVMVLNTFDDAYRRYGLGSTIGSLDDIPTLKLNLKKLFIHLKTCVDYAYFNGHRELYQAR